MKKTNTNTIITQPAPGSYIASDFSIKQGEKRKRIDAIRNRISDFDRRRISQPKSQKKKDIENTSWKVLAYGIYARVVDVSEIERVSAANE